MDELLMDHQELTAGEARRGAWERQLGRCWACGDPMPVTGWDAHHRQRRRILGWCLCNVVALHHGCHMTAHQHPAAARATGLIVSAYSDPRGVAIVAPLQGRLVEVRLTCDGTMR